MTGNNYKTHANSICNSDPAGCLFHIMHYPQGSEHSTCGLEQHLLILCIEGYIRLSSNLFQEESLCAGEMLFIPRGSDYHGEMRSDATLLLHCFNNTAIEDVFAETTTVADIFNLQGIIIKRNAFKDDLHSLPAGIYIVNGKKVVFHNGISSDIQIIC